MNKPGQIGWKWDSFLRLLFIAYAIFGAPALARPLKSALREGGENAWIPAIVILVVILLEAPGLYWKVLFTRRRALDQPVLGSGGHLTPLFMAAGIGHMIVTMFLGMTALDAMGLMEPDSPGWVAGIIILLFFKDMGILFATAGNSTAREAPGHWKDRISDVLLLLFGAVAYTVWWEVLVDLGEAGETSLPWWTWLILGPVMGLLFLMVYLPLRLNFLIEEVYLQPAEGRRGRLLMEFGGGVLLGLYPLFF